MNRSMDNLEELSDAELRHRLLQYGFPNLPVTDTTRKILIKKLRNHMNNERTKLRRETAYATRYSSDEESDVDSKKKNLRSSTAAGKKTGGGGGGSIQTRGAVSPKRATSSYLNTSIEIMPPPSSPILSRRPAISPRNFLNNSNEQQHNNNNDNYHHPVIGSSIMNNSSTNSNINSSTLSRIHVPPPIIAQDTDEDSDCAGNLPTTKVSSLSPKSSYSNVNSNRFYSMNSNVSPRSTVSKKNASPPIESSNYSMLSPSSSYNNYKITDNTKYNNDLWLKNRYSSNLVQNKNLSPSSSSPSAASSSPTYVDSISSSTSPTMMPSSSYVNGHSPISDSPYPSDFTRRLLNLRGETLRDSVYMADSGGNGHCRPRIISGTGGSLGVNTPDPAEIVHQQPEPRSEFNISPKIAFSNFITRLDEQYGVKQTLIPCALLSALVLFFALVALLYMTISPDLANTISERNTQYKLCSPEASSSAITMSTSSTCIEKGSLEGALELLRLIAPELQRRIEEKRCNDPSAPYVMNAKEVILYAQKHRQDQKIDVRKTLKDLHNMEYLIEQNPHWQIAHVDENGNRIGLKEVLQLRNTQGNYLAILEPKLPFTCALYNKMQTFFLFVGGFGIIFLIGGGIYFLYRIITMYSQSRKEKVTFYIDEIINALMRKAAMSPAQSSIVVNHMRDKLIPLHKRKELEWAWNEAISYLENNESRIQFEIGVRNGEDCKLMKWVDTVSLDQIEQQKSSGKKWHSPAFDKTNKIFNPPTPCLKIRQMFDKFEANNPNLKTIIQDAILEKVGPNCKIYDIQLDKINCCVYVRCATIEDAGVVHNEINGWWFDKRLVSIKFLKLERYLIRFPASISNTKCLRPSNTKNLSMSQCLMYNNSSGNLRNGIEYDDDDDEQDEDEVDNEN